MGQAVVSRVGNSYAMGNRRAADVIPSLSPKNISALTSSSNKNRVVDVSVDTVSFLLHLGKIVRATNSTSVTVVFEAERFAESTHWQEPRISFLLLDHSPVRSIHFANRG